MAITGILDPRLVEIPSEAVAGAYFSVSPRNITYDNVRSTAEAAPVFDDAHAVYISNIVDSATQRTIGNNLAGLQDPLHLEPTLSYEITRGYSTTNETSRGFTTTVTQGFEYKFQAFGANVGGSTEISASGSVNWTDSTTNDETTTITQSVSAPFDVPAGRVYEERLVFTQQTVEVPYALNVQITGFVGGNEVNGFYLEVGNIYQAAASARLELPAYNGVDWSDFGWTGPNSGTGLYTLHGTLTMKEGGTTEVVIRDATNDYAPAPAALRAAAPAGVPVGVGDILTDGSDVFRATASDDLIEGRAGDDRIALGGGDDIAYGEDGDDSIRAGEGRSLLDGGAGDDRLVVASSAPYGNLLGGEGDDVLVSRAPASMMYGGAGDDRFRVYEATAGGTVVDDGEGRNRLRVETDAPLGFERVEDSDNLYILLGGGETYDRARDVVWVDFFAGGDNRVNGLRADEIEALAVTFRPEVGAVPAAEPPPDPGPLG